MFYAYRTTLWVYLAFPVIAGILATRAAQRSRSARPVRAFLVMTVSGTMLGSGMVLLYTLALKGRISPQQVALASYFSVAVLCAMKALNVALTRAAERLFGVPSEPAPGEAPSLWAAQAAVTLRVLLLFAVGLPYLMGMVLVYRPRMIFPGDPQTLLRAPFNTVGFSSTDGVDLAGWWIPAATAGSHRTVIFCHGFGADKAAQLRLARNLVPAGYNLLAFDFRAHGASGGQMTTFGDLERRDVLGAVHWLRENHPEAAHRIFGLGINMGAAALIGAAADPGADGQAIDAVAVFEPFDGVASLTRAVADEHFAPVPGWVAARMSLPMAGAQLGADLAHYSVLRDVQELWPRPLLVIHGTQDNVIPFEQGERLFESASQPKYRYWVQDEGRDAVLFTNEKASATVQVFFEKARSIL